MDFAWRGGKVEGPACPACGAGGPRQAVLSMESAVERGTRHVVARCGGCGTLVAEGMSAPDYANPRDIDVDLALRFYLEQGAGLQAMVRPLFAVPHGGVRGILEVGCGFGLSLDFARLALGWRAKGIDPSPLAARGRAQLGLDIESRYLEPGGMPDGGPFDLVLCSEVVEHVPDPAGFLATVAGTLGPDGVLLLTTPDAAIVRPDRPEGEVLQALSPGYHLNLFSEAGLRALLARVGLPHVEVAAEGMQLVAAASHRPLQPIAPTGVDRSLLRGYLDRRLALAEAGGSLWLGLAYRRLREHLDAGETGQAAGLLDALAAAVRDGFGIDPLDMDGWSPPREGLSFADHMARYPANLCGILYAAGTLELMRAGPGARAAALFRAAGQAGAALTSALKGIGVEDAETGHLTCLTAALALPSAAAAGTPGVAGEWLRTRSAATTAEAEEALDRALPPVFTTLVARGDLAEADRVWPAMRQRLETGTVAAPDVASAWFGGGILLLNHRADHLAAAAAFREAGKAAGDGDLYWQAAFHEGLALSYAGQRDAAAPLFRRAAQSPESVSPGLAARAAAALA